MIQLDSEIRKDLCLAQGLAFSTVFSQIECKLLPEFLALVSKEKQGKDKLYHLLIATVPELGSLINRGAVVKQKMDERLAQIAALQAEYQELEEELKSIKAKENNQISNMPGENKTSEKKRERS